MFKNKIIFKDLKFISLSVIFIAILLFILFKINEKEIPLPEINYVNEQEAKDSYLTNSTMKEERNMLTNKEDEFLIKVGEKRELIEVYKATDLLYALVYEGENGELKEHGMYDPLGEIKVILEDIEKPYIKRLENQTNYSKKHSVYYPEKPVYEIYLTEYGLSLKE